MITRSSKDLDTTLSSMCYEVHTNENDDINVKSPPKLLAPDSSWSVLLDIREIAKKSAQAEKRCSHSLRLFSHVNGQISLVCQICRSNDTLPDKLVTEGGEKKREEEQSNEASEISRDDRSKEMPSPSQEETDTDDEIDQLLMDTPEKEAKQTSQSQQNSLFLKLRPLASLLETSNSDLPSFSSCSLGVGQDPMNPMNIPRYQPDKSLTDEAGDVNTYLPHPLRVLDNYNVNSMSSYMSSSAAPQVSALSSSVSPSVPPMKVPSHWVRANTPPTVQAHTGGLQQVRVPLPVQGTLASVTRPGGPPGPPGPPLHYYYSVSSPGGGKIRAKVITPVRQGAIRPQVSCICSLTVVVYFSLFMSL